MSGQYDVAQVCLNGHMVNDSCNTYPQHSKKCCPQCGEATINACQHCRTSITGHYYIPRVASIHEEEVHAFCHQCGKPYPWTERKEAAALELFIETLDVKQEDQGQLRRDLADIATDNPRTQVASFRIKRWLGKAKDEALGALRDIVVDIASETAKKAIWPDKP